MINSDCRSLRFLNGAVKLAALRLGAAACVLHQFDRDDQTITHLAAYAQADISQEWDASLRGDETLRRIDYLQATLQRQPTYQNYHFPAGADRRDRARPIHPGHIQSGTDRGAREMSPLRFPCRWSYKTKFRGMVFSIPIRRNSGGTDPTGNDLADQVALALENARLHQREQQRQRELQTLLDVAGAANSSLNLDER